MNDTDNVAGNRYHISSDEPRVFHLITRLLKGGAEEKIIQTVFRQENYHFTVGYGGSHDDEQIRRLQREDITTRRFPLIRHYNPVTAPMAVISVGRYIHQQEFDLVHTHSTEAGIIGRLAAHRAGVPSVHTIHGIPFTEDRHNPLNRFILACERWVAPMTNRIVTNADAMAEDYLSRGIGNPDQYETVYSGIDVERFATASPATDLPGDGLRITMVGRLVEGKGLSVLLDSVEKLDYDNINILIVGDGPEQPALENDITNRGLDDIVYTLGYRDDVEKVLTASDIFVLPSFREGTPRVITEAMASGLPIVATNIAGIPEQITDNENGYLIPTGDAAALTDRLDRLLAASDRRASFGKQSRKRVERFSLKKTITDINSVYQDVLED